MKRFSLQAQVLQPGQAIGNLIVLDEELSFWGGYDPKTGTVIDRLHPQAGISLKQQVVALPASRGSAGTPAGVAESLRVNHGPCGIILCSIDVNIAIGAAVAAELYDCAVPVVCVDVSDYDRLESGQRVEIGRQGQISVSLPEQ